MHLLFQGASKETTFLKHRQKLFEHHAKEKVEIVH